MRRIIAVLFAVASLSLASPGTDLVMRETPHLRLISDRQLAPRLDSLAALSESLWQEL